MPAPVSEDDPLRFPRDHLFNRSSERLAPTIKGKLHVDRRLAIRVCSAAPADKLAVEPAPNAARFKIFYQVYHDQRAFGFARP